MSSSAEVLASHGSMVQSSRRSLMHAWPRSLSLHNAAPSTWPAGEERPGKSIRESTYAEESLSQLKQAVFTLSLMVTCTISLFVLAPRLAFSGSPRSEPFQRGLFVLQELFSFLFLVLYTVGARELKRMRMKKLRALKIVNSTELETSEEARQRWSRSTLDHPANYLLQVVCASLVPIITDFVMYSSENHTLRWIGCLRILHILNFGPAFTLLDTNLSLPASMTPMLRNILILLFTTHYGACFYWLLARRKEFSMNTWVGRHRPELIDASANLQYLHSLYFSLITLSTVGYGDIYPVSKSEITATICYVTLNILVMANIIGVVSALAALKDTGLAEQRARIARFERMLEREHITADVVKATREYLRLALRFSQVDVDSLPVSVRMRIRSERFGDLLRTMPLFHGTSENFIRECISMVKEDSFMKGLDVVRRGDLSTRLIIIIDGHATIEVSGAKSVAALDYVGLDDSIAHTPDVHLTDDTAAILHHRACFGTEGFVCAMSQPWTIRAATLLRVVSIDEEDRRELERSNPNDWSKMRTNLKMMTKSFLKACETTLSQVVSGKAPDTRLRIDRLRTSLEAPSMISEDCVNHLIQITHSVLEAIQRDASRASHSLSALHCHVAGSGDVKELRRLVELVPVSEVPGDYDGRVALHLAAANGHVDCIRLLLGAGADPNTVDRFGRTPLMEAVLNDQKEVITLLREHDAELQLNDRAAAQYLCEAASAADITRIRNYLDAGLDPNVQDYDFRTCLMVAAAEGSFPICRMLLGRGANANAKDRWGHTAADEAKFFGHNGTLYDLMVKAQESVHNDQERTIKEKRSRPAPRQRSPSVLFDVPDLETKDDIASIDAF